MNSGFQDNGTEVYASYNEEKSVVVERFIRNFKNKIYMTSMLKNS